MDGKRASMRLTLAIGLGLLATAMSASGQHIHRNAFEARHPVWRKGPADGPFQELKHEMTGQVARTGQQSEFIQLTAEQGSHIHYLYPVGRADIADDLAATVWVRANRPGTQLVARVVLPREPDPNNLDQPSTTIIRGDTYKRAGRWDRLELRGVVKLVQQQQQFMNFEQKRPVNFDGAYVDQLMLNVYSGKGLTEVWIDDLEVGPLAEPLTHNTRSLPVGRPGAAKGAVKATPAGRPDPEKAAGPVSLQRPRDAVIELNQDRLQVDRKPFFVRAIRHSDTPMKVLRDAGFNTLVVDYAVPEETLNEAVSLGFWLAPEMPVLENESHLGDRPGDRLAVPSGLSREVQRYPQQEHVLFWYMGGGLVNEQADAAGRAAQAIRSADPYQGRPVAGGLWDGFTSYSRHLDMLAVHRWPLLTGLELDQYRHWLMQRRFLARGGSYLWTWVQTHLPDWYVNLAFDYPTVQGFREPIGPQPEQIRLLTYVALSAGYRGLGFWSDRFLANTHHGRDRLLQLALLNQELEMLEPMLATAAHPSWIPTRHPEVMACVMRFEGGVLVLPIYLGKGSQFVPGQLTAANLKLVVPEAPQDAQVWEVSPGNVRPLESQREAGGIHVVVPEFGLTTALVLTSDVNAVDGGLIGWLQQKAAKSRRMAAQWSCDLAAEELRKVETVNQQIEALGLGVPGAHEKLKEAKQRLQNAQLARSRSHGSQIDLRESYLEAQRALRPLRALMWKHWDKAITGLDSPVCTPYAVSFFTLPRHYQLMQEVQSASAGPNILPQGSFEEAEAGAAASWITNQVNLDPEVELSGEIAREQPQQGQRCLKLQIKPRDPKAVPAAFERTYLAVSSPAYRIQPGTIVRISGWVRVPKPIEASADGVLLFDSIGGEGLAVRLTGATPWRQFSLYRRVPASGTVGVTMALTGIGAAYFDDIRIEPLHPNGGPTAQRPVRTSITTNR